uniref:Fibronectin type-III domain-containing protein n=1 Tax=Parascaris equorum TaxID=6256 RepID=A0A914RUD6_PAREQ
MLFVDVESRKLPPINFSLKMQPEILLWNQEVKADELIATLFNLETERTYYMHVQAINSKGLSPMSQLPLHSFNIVGYSIRFNSSTGIGKELTLTSPIEKHIIDGLEPNTVYSFKNGLRSDFFLLRRFKNEAKQMRCYKLSDKRVMQSNKARVIMNTARNCAFET